MFQQQSLCLRRASRSVQWMCSKWQNSKKMLLPKMHLGYYQNEVTCLCVKNTCCSHTVNLCKTNQHISKTFCFVSRRIKALIPSSLRSAVIGQHAHSIAIGRMPCACVANSHSREVVNMAGQLGGATSAIQHRPLHFRCRTFTEIKFDPKREGRSH